MVHKAHIVERTLERPLIGGDVAPDPDHTDPIHVLSLMELVAVAIENFAFREIGGAGDHRDLVARLHPFARVFNRFG